MKVAVNIQTKKIVDLIDSICLTRECDKEYLVSKILAKNKYYSIEVGKLTGIRKRDTRRVGWD